MFAATIFVVVAANPNSPKEKHVLSCTSPENKPDYVVRGKRVLEYADGTKETKYDFCLSNEDLMEYYCNPEGNYVDLEYKCPGKC